MSVINFGRKEIVAKIVYYGPALSGKTTNVKKIHESVPASKRGKLTSLATKEDRTLFFDYVPIHLGNIGGFKTKFQIFTVPGQVIYAATRRIVLQGVDGVVFVADSTPGTMEANRNSLEDLKENLLHHGKHINAIPLVMQYNKRDLEEKIPIEELEDELNLLSVPSFRASAIQGMGVLPTLSKISSMVLTHLKASIEGRLVHGRSDPSVVQKFTDDEVDDEALVRDLMAQIHRVRAGEVDTDIEIVDDQEDDEDLLGDDDEEVEEAATRLIRLPPRRSSAQLADRGDEGESATLTGNGATLVGDNRLSGDGFPAAAVPESTEGRTEPTVETPPARASLSEIGEDAQGVTADGAVDVPSQASGSVGDGADGSADDSRDVVDPTTSRRDPADGREIPPPPVSEGGDGYGPTGPVEDQAEGRSASSADPLSQMTFPQEEEGYALTDYHLAGLKISPPPEQLSEEPDRDVPGAGPGAPAASAGGNGVAKRLEPYRSQSGDRGTGADGPSGAVGGTAGSLQSSPHAVPRIVSAPATTLPKREGLEVLDVGRPVLESSGIWAVPVTVKTNEEEGPSIVVFRATFDDSELPEQPVRVPAYIPIWLAGLTVLTLLSLALGLGLI